MLFADRSTLSPGDFPQESGSSRISPVSLEQSKEEWKGQHTASAAWLRSLCPIDNDIVTTILLS